MKKLENNDDVTINGGKMWTTEISILVLNLELLLSYKSDQKISKVCIELKNKNEAVSTKCTNRCCVYNPRTFVLVQVHPKLCGSEFEGADFVYLAPTKHEY